MANTNHTHSHFILFLIIIYKDSFEVLSATDYIYAIIIRDDLKCFSSTKLKKKSKLL